MKKILSYYKRKRDSVIIQLFALAVLMSWAKFLWDIESRNLWIQCFPEQTYLACFNSQNIGYTLVGFITYPVAIGWFYFLLLLVPIVFLELGFILNKRVGK